MQVIAPKRKLYLKVVTFTYIYFVCNFSTHYLLKLSWNIQQMLALKHKRNFKLVTFSYIYLAGNFPAYYLNVSKSVSCECLSFKIGIAMGPRKAAVWSLVRLVCLSAFRRNGIMFL